MTKTSSGQIHIDWSRMASVLGFDDIKTKQLFSDGRLSGELLQHVAISQFNWTNSLESTFDAFLPNQEKVEIRLITRNGLNTRPSNQSGKSRGFNLTAYIKKLDYIDYFLLIDIREFGDVLNCYLVPAGNIKRYYQTGLIGTVGETNNQKVIDQILEEAIQFPAMFQTRTGRAETALWWHSFSKPFLFLLGSLSALLGPFKSISQIIRGQP